MLINKKIMAVVLPLSVVSTAVLFSGLNDPVTVAGSGLQVGDSALERPGTDEPQSPEQLSGKPRSQEVEGSEIDMPVYQEDENATPQEEVQDNQSDVPDGSQEDESDPYDAPADTILN